jgi:hypothetical protein
MSVEGAFVFAGSLFSDASSYGRSVCTQNLRPGLSTAEVTSDLQLPSLDVYMTEGYAESTDSFLWLRWDRVC